MAKSSTTLSKIIRFLCIALIIWFCVYFLLGERFSITFTDRVFASWFPQILVFLAAASVYVLFISGIKSSRRKWQNILLFFGGFLLAIIPFLAYHGYFQYQCGIWNREVKREKVLYINKLNKFESVKIIQSTCKQSQKELSDTIVSKQLTQFFELNNPVKIGKSEKSDWATKK